jgi:hypothetical protein
MRVSPSPGNRPEAASLRREPGRAARNLSTPAFTLLEVMVALGIFFATMFAILNLVSGTLRNLRSLQQNEPDPGMIAAQIALTNILSEGVESGDFDNLYRGYTWAYETGEVTNGLFRVDIAIHHRVGRQDVPSCATVLFFRPNSPRGMGGAVLQ